MENQQMLDLYRRMLLIRTFEKKLDFLFKRGAVLGTCHLCIGQEAIPVALCKSLQPGDYAVGTHRGHGLALAKGVEPARLMEEIMGRSGGICGGRGGSQHGACRAVNFLGTNGITAGGLPLAAGAAFACKYRKSKNIVAVTLGDGATNEGVFHETMNIASLWKLPLLLVCENNLYGMSNHIEKSSSEPLLWKRAAAYNMEAIRTDGNDIENMLAVFTDSIRKVRNEQRPVFIECMTYRWMGHSKSDPLAYRTREEEASWRERCPIRKLHGKLLELGLPAERLTETEKSVRDEIERIATETLASPSADPGKLYEHVYAK